MEGRFGKNGPFRAESTPNRAPGLRPGLEETAFQADHSQRTPIPGVVPERVLEDERREPNPPPPFPKMEEGPEDGLTPLHLPVERFCPVVLSETRRQL